MQELVTIQEFIQQVWEIEHVKINITLKPGCIDHLVRPYDFEHLPDDATVNDLKERVNECINKPFIIFMN